MVTSYFANWPFIALALVICIHIQSCSDTYSDKGQMSSKTDEPPENIHIRPGTSFSYDEDENRCVLSLAYTIGEIDPRFRITERTAREVFVEAIHLWGSAVDSLRVTESESDGILVEFVYDERQQLVEREREYQEQIRYSENRIDQLQQEYDRERIRFQNLSEEYRLFSDSLQSKINTLNQWVRRVNDSGGFGEQELAHYESEQNEISELQSRDEQNRILLSRMADQVNSLMNRLNEQIDENNLLVDRYNEQFAGDQRFTSGRYIWTENRGRITVYQFQDQHELKLILAHELGHSFGIGHVSNPISIMHEQMNEQLKSSVLQLSPYDHDAIRSICISRDRH